MRRTALEALGDPLPVPRDDGAEARAAVSARAAALLALTRERFPSWTPPPFTPVTYAEALGIPVVESRQLAHWDALLVPAGDSLRIVCSATGRSAGRRRFSVAHELAHTFFAEAHDRAHMRVRRVEPDATPEERALERLCDFGAAELLMPQPWFAEAAAQHGLRALSVPWLAAFFGVSLEAAALRLVETAPAPCAVGFFHWAAEPTVERARSAGEPARKGNVAYRVRRLFCSRGFPFVLPEGKSVPDTSVVYRCSLRPGELEGRERLGPRGAERELAVTASPIHRGPSIDAPPLVVAVMTPRAESQELRR
jgi:Zn-dependent peptidase ImmA (M78 family)